MTTDATLQELRARARAWLDGGHEMVRWDHPDVPRLAKQLKADRQFELLAQLTERAARLSPRDPSLRRLQAQALIEIGHCAAAADVLRVALRNLPDDHDERLEIEGLIGRAYKQMFVDSTDKEDAKVEGLLTQALQAYGDAWKSDKKPYWHGVNYLALRRWAGRLGLVRSGKKSEGALARELIDLAPATDHEGKPDHWGLATRFEASLALSDVDASHRYLRDLLSTSPPPFNVGSLLRQLEQVWAPFPPDASFTQLVDALRAHHASLPGAQLSRLPADSIATMQQSAPLPSDTLEAIFGHDGPKTMEWWQNGLGAAKSIAAIISPEGRTIGTGFAVSAKALCDRWDEGLVVLTNYHVCNTTGATPGLHYQDVVVAFTAHGPTRYPVAQVMCESRSDQLDFAVLRLSDFPAEVAPLTIKWRLPLRPTPESPNRVFVIGHPDGRALEFSVLGSDLLDVEDPPAAAGQGPSGRRRLHYRTPTEKGSSGSPVFPSSAWEVLALHHAGGELRRFNGQPGTWLANEGISLASIRDDIGGRC